jgi:hypothetical protein
VPRNTELIGIAQATDFEFITNNPGDWMFHCHMVHHIFEEIVRRYGNINDLPARGASRDAPS